MDGHGLRRLPGHAKVDQWGLSQLGGHVSRGWSSTQKVIAWSSGGAEYYGLLRGSLEVWVSRSISKDMNVDVKIKIHEDSVAAKGIADRSGLGKVRHVEVHQLWVQDKVATGDIEVSKVDGKTKQILQKI